MPYIKEDRRDRMDWVVKAMIDWDMKVNGELNYILYKYCLKYVPKNYNSLKNYIGELSETITEIRRRILSPYEDEQKTMNGDIE
ncbi:hypothetical protein KKE60_06010 [Patescibacteria group bacterium]|nr:hypothetical protein [Patescibacteria group bacterium]